MDDCECGYSCGSSRSFLTKEEKIEMLKEYKKALEEQRKELENEAKGVSERIAELEKAN